jgi:hypothetical protein
MKKKKERRNKEKRNKEKRKKQEFINYHFMIKVLITLLW